MVSGADNIAAFTTQPAIDRLQRFHAVREFSRAQVAPLSAEDMGLQAMADASPPKWHLAHTSWFFETFVLEQFEPGFKPFNSRFRHLFNSYYETVGTFHPRHQRGLLSRPSVDEVQDYRANIDQRIDVLANQCDAETWQRIEPLILLGTHHEQQHQELLFTDTLYNFSQNPLTPAYRNPPIDTDQAESHIGELFFKTFEGGLLAIGNDHSSFSFDNESPRHQIYLQPYRLANRLISNDEFRQFIEDGGYQTPVLWLSDGWAMVQNHQWQKPHRTT